MRYMQENNNKVPLIKLKIFLSPCDLKTETVRQLLSATYLNIRPSDALSKIKDVSFHISISYSVGSRTCHEVTLVTAC